MAATYNTIPTLNGALWSGNAQLATKRYVDAQFSTIDYELTHISSQTIVNASTIDTFSISSIFGDFQVSLVSSLQFNPSLGGVNVDLGMGGFLGGLLGGAGAGLFNTALGAAALGTGIAGLVMPRGTNQINSNVFETFNGTSQLQISTLGAATWTTQRLVSSIQPNVIPGREIFVSTLIPAGRTCIRTFSDPLNLASPSTLTSTIQSYGQWADLLDPFESDFTASNIKITYQNQPGLWLSTTNTATSNFITPWDGQPPVAPYVLAERMDNYISTTQRYVSTPFTYTKISTFGAINATPAIMDSNYGNRSFLTLSPGAPSGFVNANAYPNGPGAIIDVDTTGTGQMGFYFRGTAPPTTPDVVILPNSKQRISDWSWNGTTFEYSIGTTPLAQSTIVNTLGRLQTSILQNTSTTYFSTNGTFCFDNQLKVYGNSNQSGLLVSTFGSSSNAYPFGYQPGDNDPTTYFKAAEFLMTTSTTQSYAAQPTTYNSIFYFPLAANNYPYSGNVPNFQAVIPANSNQPIAITTQGTPNQACFIDATQVPVFNGIMDFELTGTAGCAIYVKGLLSNGLPTFRDILVPGDSRMRITSWNWNGVFFTYNMIPTPDFVPTTIQSVNRNTLSLLQNNAFNYFSTNAAGGFIFDQGITTSNLNASNMNVLNFTTSNLVVSTTIVNQEFVNTIINNSITIDSNLQVGSPNDLGTSTQTIGITAGAFTNAGTPVPPYTPGQIVPAKIYCSTIGMWWSQDTSWTIETYPQFPGGIQMTINGGQTYTQDTYGNTNIVGALGCAPSTSIGGVQMSNAYVWSPLGFIANNMPFSPYPPAPAPTSGATNFCLPIPYNGVDSNGNWLPTTFNVVVAGVPQVVVQSGRYYSVGNPINFSQIFGSNGVPFSQCRSVRLRFYGDQSVNGVPNIAWAYAYSGGGGGNVYYYLFNRALSYETRPNDMCYIYAMGQGATNGSGPQTLYWPNTDTPYANMGLGSVPGFGDRPQSVMFDVNPQQNPIVYFGASYFDYGGGQIGFNQAQTNIYCDLIALW